MLHAHTFSSHSVSARLLDQSQFENVNLELVLLLLHGFVPALIPRARQAVLAFQIKEKKKRVNQSWLGMPVPNSQQLQKPHARLSVDDGGPTYFIFPFSLFPVPCSLWDEIKFQYGQWPLYHSWM